MWIPIDAVMVHAATMELKAESLTPELLALECEKLHKIGVWYVVKRLSRPQKPNPIVTCLS